MKEESARETLDYVGFDQALETVIEMVNRTLPGRLPLGDCGGLVLAEQAVSRVDSPSMDASLKDGFAVRSDDLAAMVSGKLEGLRVVGQATAGVPFDGEVGPGEALSITTGAPIPPGADAVVASEFVSDGSQGSICVTEGLAAGKNVLPRGTDNRVGDALFGTGTFLGPGMLGRMAAAGLDGARVFPGPRVSIIAVGDEVVAPGGSLGPGQLYASNLVTLGAWLEQFGISYTSRIVRDDEGELESAVEECLADSDALLTSGGAWRSSRDLVVPLFERRGWNRGFHRVRIGPGKGTAFGLDGGKTVFCLPGGPPSNEMAFLQLALPGLMAMSGGSGRVFPVVKATYRGSGKSQREADWTHFMHGNLSMGEAGFVVEINRLSSRLESIASANAVVIQREGAGTISDGDVVEAQWIRPAPLPDIGNRD